MPLVGTGYLGRHRVRANLIDQRKAKGNQIRGLTSEYGLVAPKELLHLRAAIPRWLEDRDEPALTEPDNV